MSDDDEDIIPDIERPGAPRRIAAVIPYRPNPGQTWDRTPEMLASKCKLCGQAALMLFQDPDLIYDPRRTVCGPCEAAANARIIRALNANARSSSAQSKKGGFK